METWVASGLREAIAKLTRFKVVGAEGGRAVGRFVVLFAAASGTDLNRQAPSLGHVDNKMLETYHCSVPGTYHSRAVAVGDG